MPRLDADVARFHINEAGGFPKHPSASGLTVREQCKSLKEGFAMSRGPMLSSPLLLGFDEIERLIDRLGKGGSDGYPPYNIERIAGNESAGRSLESVTVQSRTETLRITLAVAGFLPDQLEITLEDNQLIVRGKQLDDKARDYIHRGIAARQFARTFVLADGIEVKSADLSHGLLSIDLIRIEPDRVVRKISIGHGSKPDKKLL